VTKRARKKEVREYIASINSLVLKSKESGSESYVKVMISQGQIV